MFSDLSSAHGDRQMRLVWSRPLGRAAAVPEGLATLLAAGLARRPDRSGEGRFADVHASYPIDDHVHNKLFSTLMNNDARGA